MNKLFKIFFLTFISILLIFPMNTMKVSATESDEFSEEVKENFIKYYYESDADELFDSLDDKTKEILKENKLDTTDPSSLLSLNIVDVLKSIFSMFTSSLFDTKTVLFNIIGIILFAAMMEAMKNSFNASHESVFNTVSILAICSIITPIVIKIIESVIVNIENTTKFILSFIPVYSSIIVASGKPLTATTFNSVLFSVMQIIAIIFSTVLIPLLSIYLAFCVVSSATNVINTKNIANSIKKSVTFVLSFCMTMFIGLLSMQSFIANSIDSIGLKATKFATSAFIPVVGGAIGDALSSVYSSINILKSTVGGFSIIAIIAGFLPILLDIVIMMLIFNIGSIVADILQVPKVSDLLKSVNHVISLMFSILLCIIIMVILSTALMITLGNGG